MPVFSDVSEIMFRVGPDAHAFGDDYERCIYGTVQRDRWMYLSGAAGDFLPNEMKEVAREVRRLARIYGWKGLIWKRLRIRNGKIVEHTVRFRIKPKPKI